MNEFCVVECIQYILCDINWNITSKMLSDDFDMDSSMVVSLISIVISKILVGVFIFRAEYVDPGRPLSVRQFVSVCFHKSWPMLMKI